MKRKPYFLFCIGIILFSTVHSKEGFFLCGSDEDGCWDYRYCACIPSFDTELNTPYCLDFDLLTCVPLSQSPNCYSLFQYKNQGECLATIFQSSANPPCQFVSSEVCYDNHVAICSPDGQPNSCVG